MTALREALRAEGLDPSRFELSREDGIYKASFGGRVTSGDDPESVASLLAYSFGEETGGYDEGPGDTAAALGEIPISAEDAPDPSSFAGLAESFGTAAELFSDERTFVSSVNDRRTLTVYETADRENAVESVTFRDSDGQNQEALGSALAQASPDRLRELGPDVFAIDEDLTEAARDRDVRRESREAARDAAEAAGVDLDEFGIDARADGTVVLQDKDTNQTRTIDPEGDLGDAIDEQTDGGSFEPTLSSSSNDTTSNVPSVDDLGGGRLAAAVAIGAAVLYGVTQS